MKYYSGFIYRGEENGFERGTVGIEDGCVVEDLKERTFSNIDGTENFKNVIVAPTYFNAHTHLGDSFITEPPPGGLEETVIPPDGMKHVRLGEADVETKGEGILRELEFMASTGTGFFCDYREGGIEGLRAMEYARTKSGREEIPIPSGLTLGRGSAPDLSDALEISDRSDGLGLSSLSDYGEENVLSLAEKLHRKNKILSAHLSEGVREDVELPIKCGADPLIHLSCALRDDIGRIAEAQVTAVICSRSNLLFSLLPNVYSMLSRALDVMIGTDNAFLTRPDMHEELEIAYRVYMHMAHGDRDGAEHLFRSALGIPLLAHGKDNLKGDRRRRFRIGYDTAIRGLREGERSFYQVLRNRYGAGPGEVKYFLVNRASSGDVTDVRTA